MRVRLGTLRTFIHEAIVSEAGAFPGQPYGRNVLSPDINSREQIGAETARAIDTAGDDEGLPEHLREPTVDQADCEGPVPPTAEPPGVYSDPFVRDSSPMPTGNIKRGPTHV